MHSFTRPPISIPPITRHLASPPITRHVEVMPGSLLMDDIWDRTTPSSCSSSSGRSHGDAQDKARSDRALEKEVGDALFGQGVSKAPGPDLLTFGALRLAWEWDPTRITLLAKHCLSLGHHPAVWKTARGVVIRKPGKPDYTQVKAYRVISLLPCLGKVIEKVVATRLTREAERRKILHAGQFGSRPRRSCVDPIAALMEIAQQAWAPRDGGEPMPTAVALMDVKGAFDHVSRRRLLHLLDGMGFDDGTCRWVDSFMQGRTIRMDINGSAGMPRDSTSGLPQGSPVSPILFALYLSPLFKEIESHVPRARALSYADDIAWIVTGAESPDQVPARDRVGDPTPRPKRIGASNAQAQVGALAGMAKTLGECLIRCEIWAASNMVEFDTAKTEAIMLAPNNTKWGRRVLHEMPNWAIHGDPLHNLDSGDRVERSKVDYNTKPTRWTSGDQLVVT